MVLVATSVEAVVTLESFLTMGDLISDLVVSLLATFLSSVFLPVENTSGLFGGGGGFLARDKLLLAGTAEKLVLGRMYEKDALCEKVGFLTSSVFAISELVSSIILSSSSLLCLASTDP